MIGSIIGDIVGSIYEFHNIKTKNFEFFNGRGSYTDDSILTLATADWILNGGDVAHYYSVTTCLTPCDVLYQEYKTPEIM